MIVGTALIGSLLLMVTVIRVGVTSNEGRDILSEPLHGHFIIEGLNVRCFILRGLYLIPLVDLWPGISIRSAGVRWVLGHKRCLLVWVGVVAITVGISVLRDEAVAVQTNVRLLLLELILLSSCGSKRLLLLLIGVDITCLIVSYE